MVFSDESITGILYSVADPFDSHRFDKGLVKEAREAFYKRREIGRKFTRAMFSRLYVPNIEIVTAKAEVRDEYGLLCGVIEYLPKRFITEVVNRYFELCKMEPKIKRDENRWNQLREDKEYVVGKGLTEYFKGQKNVSKKGANNNYPFMNLEEYKIDGHLFALIAQKEPLAHNLALYRIKSLERTLQKMIERVLEVALDMAKEAGWANLSDQLVKKEWGDIFLDDIFGIKLITPGAGIKEREASNMKFKPPAGIVVLAENTTKREIARESEYKKRKGITYEKLRLQINPTTFLLGGNTTYEQAKEFANEEVQLRIVTHLDYLYHYYFGPHKHAIWTVRRSKKADEIIKTAPPHLQNNMQKLRQKMEKRLEVMLKGA